MQRIASSSSVSSFVSSSATSAVTSDSEHEQSPVPTESDSSLLSPPMNNRTRRMMNASLTAAAKVDNYSCSSSSSNKEEEDDDEESSLIPPPLTFKQLSLSAAIARPVSTPYNEKTTNAAHRPSSVTMSRVEAASGSSTDAEVSTTSNATCHDDLGLFRCSVPSACHSVPMVRMEATSGIGQTYKEEASVPMMMSAPMVRCKGQSLHEVERLVSSKLAQN